LYHYLLCSIYLSRTWASIRNCTCILFILLHLFCLILHLYCILFIVPIFFWRAAVPKLLGGVHDT
jgi:hypothetical protein